MKVKAKKMLKELKSVKDSHPHAKHIKSIANNLEDILEGCEPKKKRKGKL